MDNSELEARIDAIAEAMQDHAYPVAAELADDADRAIDQQPDPTLYGRLSYYRFRAAYELAQWERAWQAVPPRFTFVVAPAQAAWLFAARAEVAARTGRIEELLAHAAKSIGIRREMGDVPAMLETARLACELLHEVGRDELNGHFLPIILGEARFHGLAALTAYGYLALVRNIAATQDPICIDILLDGREWLARCDDEHAQLALELARTSPLVQARVATRATTRLRAVAPPAALELA